MRAILLSLTVTLYSVCAGAATAQDAMDPLPPKGFAGARQPQLAVGPSGGVVLTFGIGNSVYSVASSDGAKSFGAPVKVADLGALALGMRRGPRIAATAKAVVIAAIGGKVGKGRDGDVLAWRSTDAGATWQGPARVNSVAASAREGLHHLTAGPDGTVYCVWLDLRDGQTQVYGAASLDGGATWEREKLVYRSPDGSVCECCQPQAAFAPDGTLYVMWRNQLAGARDIYLTNSKDGGKTFAPAVKLGTGTWPLNACPMDGGGLARGPQGEVETVWMRKKELFRCKPGETEVSLGKGEQGWAAAGPDGVHLVWIVGRPGAVMVQRPGSARPQQLSRSGLDPVVAGPASGKGPVVAAWEEGKGGSARIRVAVLSPAR